MLNLQLIKSRYKKIMASSSIPDKGLAFFHSLIIYYTYLCKGFHTAITQYKKKHYIHPFTNYKNILGIKDLMSSEMITRF